MRDPQPAADVGIFYGGFNERCHISWGRITHAGPAEDQPGPSGSTPDYFSFVLFFSFWLPLPL